MLTPAPVLHDLITLGEATQLAGAPYTTVWTHACAGAFGPSVAVGRTLLYQRAIAEPALARFRAERAKRSRSCGKRATRAGRKRTTRHAEATGL